MQPWNKNNLRNWGVVLAVVLVIASLIIAAVFAFKAGGIASIIIPAIASAYGCVVFVKKYYVKNVYKEKK